MRPKWTETESKYFSKPILTVERNYDWVGWLILAMCSLAGLAYLYMEVAR